MPQSFDLVFEGGGAKGIVFVGALRALEEAGFKPGSLIGTSAGAITATLTAAGYDAKKLDRAVNETLEDGKPVFGTFLDQPRAEDFTGQDKKGSLTYALFKKVNIPFVPELVENKIDDRIIDHLMELKLYRILFSFIERGGLFSGHTFLEWMQTKLRTTRCRDSTEKDLSRATFREFHEATGNDLSMVASDTTGQSMLVLNHRTAPDCPVAHGVRMSMSIPFLWQEVRWNPRWGTYRGRDIAGHTIVDGGALSNFPIDFLTSTDDEIKGIMGPRPANAGELLGLLIDEEQEVPAAGQRSEPDETEDYEAEVERIEKEDPKAGLFGLMDHLKTVRRIMRLADTMRTAHDNLNLRADAEADVPKVCRLPAKGYGTTEFNMTADRKKKLMDAGYETTIKHLKGRKLVS